MPRLIRIVGLWGLLGLGFAGLPAQAEGQPAAADQGDLWFPDDGLDFEQYIGGVELALIRRSLERTQGNKRQAAKLLNLKRTTLIEKLKRLEPR